MPGIIIELKAGKECTGEALEGLAETALAQIESKKYDTDMKVRNVGTILKYGVAFCGKEVKVCMGSTRL